MRKRTGTGGTESFRKFGRGKTDGRALRRRQKRQARKRKQRQQGTVLPSIDPLKGRRSGNATEPFI